jgi:hypothetical protein
MCTTVPGCHRARSLTASRTGSLEIAKRCSRTLALLGVFISLMVLLLGHLILDLQFIVLVLKLLQAQ